MHNEDDATEVAVLQTDLTGRQSSQVCIACAHACSSRKDHAFIQDLSQESTDDTSTYYRQIVTDQW